MKPSKDAMFDYVLGSIVITLGLVLSLWKGDITLFFFGFVTCNMLFILGIHQDLYRKEEKKVEA